MKIRSKKGIALSFLPLISQIFHFVISALRGSDIPRMQITSWRKLKKTLEKQAQLNLPRLVKKYALLGKWMGFR